MYFGSSLKVISFKFQNKYKYSISADVYSAGILYIN